MASRQERHHILFPRAEYSLRPNALRLRGDPSLILPIDHDAHRELHEICPPVPLLGHYALQHVLSLYEPQDTHLDSLEYLMSSIEASSRTPKSHIVEKQLALLAVNALDYQRIFIMETMS